MTRRRFPAPTVPLALAAALLAFTRCNAMRPVARVGPMQEQEFTVDREGTGDTSLRVSFWGGTLRVKPAEVPCAARLHTRDNVDSMEPHADTRRDGDHLDVRFWLDSEDNVVNLKSWSGDKDEPRDPERDIVNEWNLELARAVPLALELDLAACEADVELGGIPLRAMRLDLGGGDATLAFGRPNPERLDRLSLSVGAGRLAARSLGNAHARTISVDAGAGSCLLDLAGDWRADALVEVDAGACGVEIRVPRDLAVKANLRETILAGLSAPEFADVGDHCFASPAWGRGGPEVVVEVTASLGTVRLVLE